MDYTLLALIIISVVLFLDIFVIPRLSKKLTPEQLHTIDFACEKAVGYAEQLYKNGEITNEARFEIAVDTAMEIVREAKIIPERYLGLLEIMIEDAVRKLPMTHDRIEVQVDDNTQEFDNFRLN